MSTRRWFLVSTLAALALVACAHLTHHNGDVALSDEAVLRHASARLEVERGEVLLGNDAAFRAKLEAIRAARTSIDAMYFIYADDVSSSVISQELIAAAKRGVRVRLLVDFQRNYEHLDLFTMMEKQARGGTGSLTVHFYNRPSRNMVMDAVYLTMGCGEVGSSGFATCAAAKSAEIERRFADERIDGVPASQVHASNLQFGNSGLFLAGLYARDFDAITMAVVRGQEIDIARLKSSGGGSTAEQKQQLARIGRIYWHARFDSGFARLVAKLQLAFAFALYGKTLNPIHDTFTSYLPLERRGSAESMRDWDYMTEFLHHKLLLVDNTSLQLGGRNIEDSYHMRPNPLVEKYIFMDTDFHATLRSGGEKVERAFEELWNYHRMVASSDEVRQVAPNDFVANEAARKAAEKACTAGTDAEKQECMARELQTRALSLEEREAARLAAMTANAERYRNEYPFVKTADPSPAFTVDPGVLAAYIENLPFRRGPGGEPAERSYGGRNDHMAEDGKQITYLWNAGLEETCRAATLEHPGRIVLHQAYFRPPSFLIAALGRMVDGTLDCHNVTVTVLTNSPDTTDLSIVNLLARHELKAFAEYAGAKRNPARSARFEYYEYRKQDTSTAGNSLHTKVSVLGDDIIIGSANADARSYMMDGNNGVYLRHVPQFLTAYRAYVDSLTRDATLTRNQTSYFSTVTQAQLLEEDRTMFRLMLLKLRAEHHLDADQQHELEEKVVTVLEDVYQMTKAILAGGRTGREKAAEFDSTFKAV